MIHFFSDWLDYIFYRASSVYRFFKDDDAFSATLVITVIKTMVLIDFSTLVLLVFSNQEFIDRNTKTLGALAGILALIILARDYKVYKHKFEALDQKWKHESRRDRVLKGFLVFLTFIAPWIPLIVKGLL